MKHAIMKDPIRFSSKANDYCSLEGQEFIRGVRGVVKSCVLAYTNVRVLAAG